jgi:hypothetical protein
MKVTIQHQTAEYGAKLLKKGKSYPQLSLTVHYTPEEIDVINRGGLGYLVICEGDIPAHLEDTEKDEVARMLNRTAGLISAGHFLPRGGTHIHTFRSLLAARNFEAKFIEGLNKLKETINHDIENPFQPSKTFEL